MRTIRFSSAGQDATPQVPNSVPENKAILAPLSRFVHTNNLLNDDVVLQFADAWVKDSQGAIATLGKVMTETEKAVKESAGQRKYNDAAYILGRLGRFMSFFRRELWDARFPGQVTREFQPKVRRSPEVQKTAWNTGVPRTSGAFYEFLKFIQKEAAVEVKGVLNKLNPPGEASQPTGKTLPSSSPPWPKSGHINDYDDFID